MIRYDRLWNTMEEKGFTQYRLIKQHGFSAGQIGRLKKNMHVSTHTIETLCGILQCGIGDIIEFWPDDVPWPPEEPAEAPAQSAPPKADKPKPKKAAAKAAKPSAEKETAPKPEKAASQKPEKDVSKKSGKTKAEKPAKEKAPRPEKEKKAGKGEKGKKDKSEKKNKGGKKK